VWCSGITSIAAYDKRIGGSAGGQCTVLAPPVVDSASPSLYGLHRHCIVERGQGIACLELGRVDFARKYITYTLHCDVIVNT